MLPRQSVADLIIQNTNESRRNNNSNNKLDASNVTLCSISSSSVH